MFEFKEGDRVRAVQDEGWDWEGIVVEVAGAIYGIKSAQGNIRWFNYTAVTRGKG